MVKLHPREKRSRLRPVFLNISVCRGELHPGPLLLPNAVCYVVVLHNSSPVSAAGWQRVVGLVWCVQEIRQRCKVAPITGNNTNCHRRKCVLSNEEGAAGCKVAEAERMRICCCFKLQPYLMRFLTAEIDLLSYFMSCFWLPAAGGSGQSWACFGHVFTEAETSEYCIKDRVE